MLSTVLFLSLILVAMPKSHSKYPPDEEDTAKTFCEHDPNGKGCETFAGAFYSAMVTQYGFDVVSGIEVSGPDAAKSEYNAVFDILDAEGLCDAAWVAFTASRPFVSLKTVPLAIYLEKSAHTTGEYLDETGLLDCTTAIPLAFDFFKLVTNAFDGLDQNDFGSYQRAVVQGLVDLLKEHGLPMDDAANDLAYKFFKEFNNQKNCTKSAN